MYGLQPKKSSPDYAGNRVISPVELGIRPLHGGGYAPHSHHQRVHSLETGAIQQDPAMDSPMIASFAGHDSSRSNSVVSVPTDTRRVWVARPNMTATAIHVNPGTIVDDLKCLIMQKFPTSLAQQCDPSDLMLTIEVPTLSATIQPPPSSSSPDKSGSAAAMAAATAAAAAATNTASLNSNSSLPPLTIPQLPGSSSLGAVSSPLSDASSAASMVTASATPVIAAEPLVTANRRITLEPDVLLYNVLDTYFPDGMAMQNAILVELPHQKNEREQQESAAAAASGSHRSRNASGNQNHRSSSASGQRGSQRMERSSSSHSRRQRRKPPTPIDVSSTRSPSGSHVASPLVTSATSVGTNSSNGSVLSEPSNALVATQGWIPMPRPRDPARLRGQSGTPVGSSTPKSSTVILFPKSAKSRENSPEPLSVNTDQHFHSQNGRSSKSRADSPGHVIVSTSPTPSSLTFKSREKTMAELKQQQPPGISKILSHINVLVVEDNLVNQKIMARHLKSCDVQFKIASTGKEALEMWREGGFHLCLMDIQLPVMSGIEVTREIRRLEKQNHIGNFATANSKEDEPKESDHLDLSLFRSPIIIVALTASTSLEDKEGALAAGCNDFLTKPVQLKWLRSKLTEWGCMQALINYDLFRKDS